MKINVFNKQLPQAHRHQPHTLISHYVFPVVNNHFHSATKHYSENVVMKTTSLIQQQMTGSCFVLYCSLTQEITTA